MPTDQIVRSVAVDHPDLAILLASDVLEDGRQKAERFRAALRADVRADSVTATCGLARLDGDRRQALIEAGVARYQGKSAGGDQIEGLRGA